MSPARAAATCLGLGAVGPAPGTLASLAAAAAGLAAARAGGWPLLAALALAAFALGWWAAARHRAETGRDDAPEVVIDEVAGQWAALLPAGGDPLLAGASFALFRLFDIAKPFPISWIDRRMKGGLGTMLDDAAAGGAAALGTWALGLLLPHG